MKKLLLIVLLFPLTAFAAEDAVITWTPGVTANGQPQAKQFNPQFKLEACALPDTKAWVYMPAVPFGTNTTTQLAVAEGVVTCYRVSASDLNRHGESDWSNRAEKTVPFAQRPVPANLQVQ